MNLTASGATQAKSTPHRPDREGQLMGPSLVRNSKIPAGKTPFRTMGGKSPASMAMGSQQMSQFMKQGSFHLLTRNLP
jgi:hypothetical protein